MDLQLLAGSAPDQEGFDAVSNSLFSTLSWITYGVMLLFAAVLIFSGGKFAYEKWTQGKSSSPQTMIGALVGTIIAGSANAILNTVTPDVSTTPSTTESTPPVVTPPFNPVPPAPFNPVPPTSAPTPSEPVNWTLWISLGMVLIALLLLAVIGLVVVRTRHKILDRQATTRGREQDWKAATTLFNQARDGFAGYLADPYAIFIRPLLDDNTVDTTAAFISALADADALYTTKVPQAQARVDAFRTAAQAAVTAWNVANAHALEVGMGTLTVKESVSVRRIKDALAIALDESAPAGERDAALRTVQRLADGLLTIPDRIPAKVIRSLESVQRKALTV